MRQIKVVIESREHFEQLKQCEMYCGGVVEKIEIEEIHSDFQVAVIHVLDPGPIRRSDITGDI